MDFRKHSYRLKPFPKNVAVRHNHVDLVVGMRHFRHNAGSNGYGLPCSDEAHPTENPGLAQRRHPYPNLHVDRRGIPDILDGEGVRVRVPSPVPGFDIGRCRLSAGLPHFLDQRKGQPCVCGGGEDEDERCD